MLSRRFLPLFFVFYVLFLSPAALSGQDKIKPIPQEPEPQENCVADRACPLYPVMTYPSYTVYYAKLYDEECCELYPVSLSGPHNLRLGCTSGDNDCEPTKVLKNYRKVEQKIQSSLNRVTPVPLANINTVSLRLQLTGVKRFRFDDQRAKKLRIPKGKEHEPVVAPGTKIRTRLKIKFLREQLPQMVYATAYLISVSPPELKDQHLAKDAFGVGVEVPKPAQNVDEFLYLQPRNVLKVSEFGTVYRVQIQGVWYQIITSAPGKFPPNEID